MHLGAKPVTECVLAPDWPPRKKLPCLLPSRPWRLSQLLLGGTKGENDLHKQQPSLLRMSLGQLLPGHAHKGSHHWPGCVCSKLVGASPTCRVLPLGLQSHCSYARMQSAPSQPEHLREGLQAHALLR